MSLVTTTDVFCDGDGCSNWTFGVTGRGDRARFARENARHDGWVFLRGRPSRDLCPARARKDALNGD